MAEQGNTNTIMGAISGIAKNAKGLSDYVSQSFNSESDVTWVGVSSTLSLAAKKLCEMASSIKSVEDIHNENYAEFISEGIQMTKIIDITVRNVAKERFLRMGESKKNTLLFATSVIIEYVKLLTYVCSPEKGHEFDLGMLFPNKDALKLAKSIWKDSKPVNRFDFEKAVSPEYIKEIPKKEGYVDSKVISPILFAAIVGYKGELNGLKKKIYDYDANLCCYSPINFDTNPKYYKPEENSMYFYIVSKKFEGIELVKGKGHSATFCITPESNHKYTRMNTSMLILLNT